VANVPAAEKEERVEAGAPPANESVEAPKETENVVAAVVSTVGPEKQAVAATTQEVGSTESRPTEETEIGGS
jgi:hypothetical protein